MIHNYKLILPSNVAQLEEDVTFKCHIISRGYYLWMLYN